MVSTNSELQASPQVQEIVVLTSVVEGEGDQFVSFCIELGTASCGDTIQEALDNLQEAIWVHLSALEETGERDRMFRELGIDVLSDPINGPIQRHIPLDKLVKTTQHALPASASLSP